MIGIDCTALKCPEFTVPALRMIKAHAKTGQELVIKTYEKRGPKRIQHICTSYNWSFIASAEQNGVVFIKIKC